MLSDKKILFLDHFNRHGGAQEYVLDVAVRLKDMGCGVTISEVSLDTLKKSASGLPTIGFHVLSKNFRNPIFYLQLIKNIFQLRRYLSKNIIDIIHCNSIPVLALAKIVKNKRQKIVLTCHDCNLNSFKTSLIKKCADAVICVSQTVKRYLEDRGVKQDKRVIYNGFAEQAAKRSRRQPNPKVTFGLIGRMEEWKGVHIYIEAAQKVIRDVGNEADFFIIGGVGNASYYSKSLKMSSGKQYIHFKPFEADKTRIYTQLDVAVNASVEIEPFGRTLVEAGLLGLPVIGPDRGGPAEIIDDGVTGLLFRTGDSGSLAQKMELLIKSETLRDTLGRNGERRCAEKFSIDAVCREIVEFYESIG